jgi:hypothetical protein
MTMTIIDELPRAQAACPDWCEMAPGHPYSGDAVVEGRVTRAHATLPVPFSTERCSMQVVATGEADRDDIATERLGAPTISVMIRNGQEGTEGYADDLSLDQFRQLFHDFCDGVIAVLKSEPIKEHG